MLSLSDLAKIKKDYIYYLFCRDLATNLGYSDWSNPIKIRFVDRIDYRGFVIYRHHSNAGTIIEYTDLNNIRSKMIVTDAKLRTLGIVWCSQTKFNLPSGMTNFKDTNINSIFLNKNDSNLSPTEFLPEYIDNNYLISKLYQYRTDKSANFNTTAVISGSVKVPAVNLCRNMVMKHNGESRILDLPNIFQLSVIFACSDLLDSIDPSIQNYLDLRLGKDNTYIYPNQTLIQDGVANTSRGQLGRFTGLSCRSSTLIHSAKYNTYYPISINCTGKVSANDHRRAFTVTPILEID